MAEERPSLFHEHHGPRLEQLVDKHAGVFLQGLKKMGVPEKHHDALTAAFKETLLKEIAKSNLPAVSAAEIATWKQSVRKIAERDQKPSAQERLKELEEEVNAKAGKLKEAVREKIEAERARTQTEKEYDEATRERDEKARQLRKLQNDFAAAEEVASKAKDNLDAKHRKFGDAENARLDAQATANVFRDNELTPLQVALARLRRVNERLGG